eukprot:04854_5
METKKDPRRRDKCMLRSARRILTTRRMDGCVNAVLKRCRCNGVSTRRRRLLQPRHHASLRKTDAARMAATATYKEGGRGKYTSLSARHRLLLRMLICTTTGSRRNRHYVQAEKSSSSEFCERVIILERACKRINVSGRAGANMTTGCGVFKYDRQLAGGVCCCCACLCQAWAAAQHKQAWATQVISIHNRVNLRLNHLPRHVLLANDCNPCAWKTSGSAAAYAALSHQPYATPRIAPSPLDAHQACVKPHAHHPSASRAAQSSKSTAVRTGRTTHASRLSNAPCQHSRQTQRSRRHSPPIKQSTLSATPDMSSEFQDSQMRVWAFGARHAMRQDTSRCVRSKPRVAMLFRRRLILV